MDTKDIHDDVVLPFKTFVKFSGLSERQCRRICQPGCGGPPVVRLSDRRLGVRMGDFRHWTKNRTRAA